MNAMRPSWRFVLLFVALFACYQAAELVGVRWLRSAWWQGVLMTAVIPLGLALGAWLYGSAAAPFALEWRRGVAGWLALGLGGGVLLKAAALVAGQAMGAYDVAPAAPSPLAPLLQAVAFTLLATFVPSMAEDMLTRGLWWRHGPWRKGLGFGALSTAVYVLNHVWRLERGPSEWLLLSCFGLAYACALLRAGSLWGAVGFHWGWNAANGLLPLAFDVQVRAPVLAVTASAVAHLVLAALCLFVPMPLFGARRVRGAGDAA
jgi:hypothetical protein